MSLEEEWVSRFEPQDIGKGPGAGAESGTATARRRRRWRPGSESARASCPAPARARVGPPRDTSLQDRNNRTNPAAVPFLFGWAELILHSYCDVAP